MERLIPFWSKEYMDPAHTDARLTVCTLRTARFDRPLSALQGKSVCFEFEMKDAALYALNMI
ncbi:MAG: hypothetical protein IJC46_07335 [Clostridia bacterium]|nr:hypothetical protein [Clostridia bacterium]